MPPSDPNLQKSDDNDTATPFPLPMADPSSSPAQTSTNDPLETPEIQPQDDSTFQDTVVTPLSATPVSDTSTSQSETSPPPSSVVTGVGGGGSGSRKKVIATIFAIVLLVVGAVSTVILVQRQALITGRAWDCSKYVFEVSRDGTVTTRNGSTKNESSQKADVYINNALVKTFTVPNLNAGQAVTLGSVTVPSSQSFTWRVDGQSDCDNSGQYGASEPTARCSDIKTYDEDWNLISTNDLSSLQPGKVVRFAVSGSAPTGSFDKARFTINGSLKPESTQKKPSTEEYYYEYSIPTGTTTFTIGAEVHHTTLGWF